MEFTIRYLNYEGDVKRLVVDEDGIESAEDAVSFAIENDMGDGDGIFKIIDVD